METILSKGDKCEEQFQHNQASLSIFVREFDNGGMFSQRNNAHFVRYFKMALGWVYGLIY